MPELATTTFGPGFQIYVAIPDSIEARPARACLIPQQIENQFVTGFLEASPAVSRNLSEFSVERACQQLRDIVWMESMDVKLHDDGGSRKPWRSSFESEAPENCAITRRIFMKCMGGATVSAVVAWHGLSGVARAEIVGSGPDDY